MCVVNSDVCDQQWCVWSAVTCVVNSDVCDQQWCVWSTVMCVISSDVCGQQWRVWSAVMCVISSDLCGQQWRVWSAVTYGSRCCRCLEWSVQMQRMPEWMLRRWHGSCVRRWWQRSCLWCQRSLLETLYAAILLTIGEPHQIHCSVVLNYISRTSKVR